MCYKGMSWHIACDKHFLLRGREAEGLVFVFVFCYFYRHTASSSVPLHPLSPHPWCVGTAIVSDASDVNGFPGFLVSSQRQVTDLLTGDIGEPWPSREQEEEVYNTKCDLRDLNSCKDDLAGFGTLVRNLS